MRIRSIKPELFRDRVTGRWPLDMQMFYCALWVYADDDGRFEWEPDLLRGSLFPYHHDIDVEGYLATLEEAKRVVRYVVDGQLFGYIPAFKKHQHPNRPQQSELPEPTDEAVMQAQSTRNAPAVSTHGARTATAVNDHEQHIAGVGGERRGGEKEEEAASDDRSLPAAETEAEPEEAARGAVQFVREHWPDVKKPVATVRSWVAAYPALDVLAEMRKAHAWETANPTNRKTNHGRFLNSWLSRAQDNASRRAPTGTDPPKFVLRQLSPPEAHGGGIVHDF